MPMSSPDRKVLVWDLSTRLFHWLVVLLVAGAYATSRMNTTDWHALMGEALLVLLLFRVLLGFFGSETARFGNFLAPPRVALQHLAHMFRREPDHQPGHNPAGGWMVILLLALLSGEVLSGIYVNNDVADAGPLTELVPAPVANAITTLHTIFWDAILASVGLHILAILTYAVVKRQDLVLPMITGRKHLPNNVKQPHVIGRARAAFLFGCSVVAAAALSRFI
jgi:cytochrome b